jgi:uncharacterized zinc-type alcohol dehydrogenase-like protein
VANQENPSIMAHISAYAAAGAKDALAPMTIERREPLDTDVEMDILFCGICHSDLHTARNEWGDTTTYPCVPGHEILGKVTRVGSKVTKFKVGDRAGVGCMVGSCGTCPDCRDGLEQFCTGNPGTVFTYNSPDPHFPGRMTYGGYSTRIVVDEAFTLRIPENLDAASAAPLNCAGITTYSPLRHWKVGPGQKVGIVGLGGLGHMGVKFAHAFGAETFVFTRSASKRADAKRLGADEIVLSSDPAEMRKHIRSFDFILDTVAASHNLDDYLELLKRDGTMVLVGVPEHPHPSPSVGSLVFARRSLAGSLIGGVAETQEMLDFCGQHNIACDVEVIPMQKVNEAYERLLKSDVKYRFSIDMATLR